MSNTLYIKYSKIAQVQHVKDNVNCSLLICWQALTFIKYVRVSAICTVHCVQYTLFEYLYCTHSTLYITTNLVESL